MSQVVENFLQYVWFEQGAIRPMGTSKYWFTSDCERRCLSLQRTWLTISHTWVCLKIIHLDLGMINMG